MKNSYRNQAFSDVFALLLMTIFGVCFPGIRTHDWKVHLMTLRTWKGKKNHASKGFWRLRACCCWKGTTAIWTTRTRIGRFVVSCYILFPSHMDPTAIMSRLCPHSSTIFHSCSNSLAEMQRRATYIRQKVVGFFSGPYVSRSYMHWIVFSL
jgi:hypothetical protein